MSKNVEVYTVFKDTDKEFIGTKKEISKHFNINYSNLCKYLKKFNIDEVINKMINSNKNKKITIFKGTNKEFIGTKKEIAKHFNINYGTLMNRINEQNMTLEEAIDTKKYDNNNFRLGETRMMKCGMNTTIVEYFNTTNITVQFEDSTIVKNKTYQNFRNGSISNPNLKEDYSKRLGETRMMNCGMKATIIEYFRSDNITVQFEDGTIVKNRAYNNFKKSETMNPNLNYFTIFKGTNKEFKGSLRQISDHFNLNYGNLKSKINMQNMTIEEAIEIPLKRVYQNDFNYKNKKGTMKELCQKFNKNFIEVYNKVKYNHTFEWAMDSTEKPYEKEE